MGSKTLVFLLSCLLLSPVVSAAGEGAFQAPLLQLQHLREEMQQKALSMLSVIRESEKTSSADNEEMVEVLSTTAAVREAALDGAVVRHNARIHEKYLILGKRDEWIEIALPGGRSGWIHEDAVQVITIPGPASPGKAQAGDIFPLVSGWMGEINILHEKAVACFDALQLLYNSMPLAEKQPVFTQFETAVTEMDQMNKYVQVAVRFYQPLADRRSAESLAAERRKFPGLASVQAGLSEYRFDRKEKQGARSLALSGAFPLNPRSDLTFGMNHQKEVLITPYSASDMVIGYGSRFGNGLTFNSRMTYNNYRDAKTTENDFGQIGASLRAEYPMSERQRLFLDYQFTDKGYETEGGNDLSSNRFDIGTIMKRGGRDEISAGLNVMAQSSDVSYLSFSRWTPRVRFQRQRTAQQTFSLSGDLDMMAYDAQAKNGNYVRENFQVNWNTRTGINRTTRQAKLIAKQFTHNQNSSYIKLGGDMRRQRGSDVTAFYGLVTFFPQGKTSQSDYLDLRVDRKVDRESWFYQVNSYTRLWSNASPARDVSHILNCYAKTGVIIPGMDIGPLKFRRFQFSWITGTHILFNQKSHFIKNDGNSIRLGLGFQSVFNVRRLTGTVAYTAERSIVYGDVLEIDVNTGNIEHGRLVTRHPLTIQWNVDARMPVTRDVDFQFSLSYFNIELKVDSETSINPVEERSKYSLTGGLAWRFDFIELYDQISGVFFPGEGR